MVFTDRCGGDGGHAIQAWGFDVVCCHGYDSRYDLVDR